MPTANTLFTITVLPMALALSGCGGSDTTPTAAEPTAAATAAATAATFPASLKTIGDGYPTAGAPCRRVGESEATSDLLDDSADLVACPTRTDAQALNGKVVGLVDDFTLVSVPTGKANAGLTTSAAAANTPTAAARDFVRGPNGLEAKCLKAVAAQGTRVVGTNRIEESQAAIEIYVNVIGGQAPWRCLAYRDGTIGEVSYTGDEGAL